MNCRLKTVGLASLFTALALVPSAQALAQASSRTWVAGLGDDNNACSRAAPCKTFARAISMTAPGGEISAQDAGVYGPVAVNKSITISGEGTFASIFGGGITVDAGPSDAVILRGLSINGAGAAGDGVTFNSGGKLLVENSTIYGFLGQGILFRPSGSSSLFVNRTTLSNNVGGGVYIAPPESGTASVSVNAVAMQGNGRGVRSEGRSKVVIRNSTATGNAANGFVALSAVSPVEMTIENSVSAHNGAAGVYAGALATVRISTVLVVGNLNGLQQVDGGAIASFRNNRVHGNINGDGAPNLFIDQK